MRRVPRCSQSEGGNPASAADVLMIPKRRRLLGECGRILWGPEAAEGPVAMRQGARWSQTQRHPHPNLMGASVLPKQRRPPGPFGGLDDSKAMEAPAPVKRGP